MELKQTTAAIETILFAMGDSVEIAALAEVLEIPQEDVREAVRVLEERCDAEGSGLRSTGLRTRSSFPADLSITSTLSK